MSRTSRAWAHHIELRTAGEESTWRGRSTARCTNGIRCPGTREWVEHEGTTREFRWQGGGTALYTAGYRYVTGRGGNVSHRDLAFCGECGAKFAKRHHLELPPLASGVPHPLRDTPDRAPSPSETGPLADAEEGAPVHRQEGTLAHFDRYVAGDR